MIHNAFLVRLKDKKILSAVKYWPVEVANGEIEEYISTREELAADHDALEDLPLVIDENKFMGSQVHDDKILVFVTDRGEDELGTKERVKKAAIELMSEIDSSNLKDALKRFEEIIEPSVVTRLKIALVGEGGTGKTTTLHLLLGDTPPLQYVPTIALNLETVENIRFGNYSLVLWDFAGQERFRTLWRFYFHGADVIILVCDSSLRNVIISKDILKLIKRDAPKVPIFALANKQDKPNAMKPGVVQKILGIPTYPMVAIDQSRRDEMLRILMTAAAQYVGVALPDLPPSELLKFSEEAAEAAAVISPIAIEEEAAEEYETVEIVEEVLIDEDGQVVEDSGDYEIVEEVIEYVEEEPIAEVDGSIEEPPAAIAEETPIEASTGKEDSIEEFYIEVDAKLSMELEKEAVEIQVESADDDEVLIVEGVEVEEIAIDEDSDLEIVSSSDHETEEAVPIELEGVDDEVVADDLDGSSMVRALISEALDADDLVAEEIDKATREELETALEAFSCDETVPIDGEEESVEDLDDEMRTDLERALGILDIVPVDDGAAEEDNRLETPSSDSNDS
ncbi:MAG: ADP-ribosylation factor-like protein [Candidatus Thorarchaeota archaeon]|jgi:small GTP-binding protein